MFAEKYRPSSLDSVVGQKEAIKRLRFLESTNAIGGRAYWIAGLSGTGKSTIAKILAGMVSEWGISEITCAELTPKAVMEWELDSRTRCIDGKGHALLVDEAHGLRKDSIRQLLVTLERLPAHCIVIFTTTNCGQDNLFAECLDAGPLLSRCVELSLNSQGEQLLLDYALHLRDIATKENCVGNAQIQDFVDLVRTKKYNLRSCLQFIESGGLL